MAATAVPRGSDLAGAIEMRRWLHAHAELAFQERETADMVGGVLERAGYEVAREVAGTGVLGVLRRGAGPVLGIRADMDALPIEETSGAPHRSLRHGVSHACGHDGHTAILLGAAERLAGTPFEGTLVLIFQPAEETGAGAAAMLESGALDGFDFAAILGLHNWPDLPLGQVALHPGAAMASADRFEISFAGRPFHPALPANGDDVMAAGSATVLALQESFLRRRRADTPAVITVSEFTTDGQRHLTPGALTLAGTIRCLDATSRAEAIAWVEEAARAAASRYGASCSVAVARGCPPTANSPHLRRALRAAAVEAVGEANVADTPRPTMGGDDFAYFLERWPGAYYWLGTGTEGARPLHAADYDFPDAALGTGIALWESVVRTFLAPIRSGDPPS